MFYRLGIFFALFSMAMPIWAQGDDEFIEEEPSQEVEPSIYVNPGFKGGLTVAMQKWNTTPHRAMPTYHGDLLVDVFGKWQGTGMQRRFGFSGSLGYHQRGSTYRVFNLVPNQKRPRDVFHNISLLLAAKGQFRVASPLAVYYGLGLRAEYTVAHGTVSQYYAPYVRPFNYGIWFGGGVEFLIKDASFFLEVSIAPDISKQIIVPQGVYSGMNDINGNPILTVQEKVSNFSLEVSLGAKFGRNP